MPLFQAKTGNVPAVLTKDGDRIVAYTLTPRGRSSSALQAFETAKSFPLASLPRWFAQGSPTRRTLRTPPGRPFSGSKLTKRRTSCLAAN
jgi:hypothetical protein